MQAHPVSPSVPSANDERDLGRVALLHTLWAAFLGASAVYYLAGPVVRLVGRAQTTGMSGVMGGAIFGAIVLALLGGWIVAHLVAASSVRQKKRRAHATFMSGLLCLCLPVGTILGLYSLSVLNRPSVRASFTK